MRWRTNQPSLVFACGLGLLLGLGSFTFDYGEGLSYFSTNPAACANCHVMNEQYDSWTKAGHHQAAVCVDCHLPHEFVPKYLAKAENGYWHSKGFTFMDFHPEFETWSQGMHARSGVACADCHMPYTRAGAAKVSDHHVRSPLLLMINRSCQTCHPYPESELKARVDAIQGRTHDLMQRGGVALTDMLDAIRAAKDAGIPVERLAPILALQRKAQWRLDFVNAENSMGFHASQETARVLGEAIDYARQGQAAAIALRAPATQPVSR